MSKILLKSKVKWQKFDHPLGGNWYRWGDTRVCVECHGGLWHISISCPNRYPTWEEIKLAWYELVPGAGENFTGAILLPRKSEFVNFHSNCFHVYQLAESEIPEMVKP